MARVVRSAKYARTVALFLGFRKASTVKWRTRASRDQLSLPHHPLLWDNAHSMTQSAVSRILKTVNALIALLAAAALAGIYWYVWRPLPQRSGTITAPVAAPVTVSFDKLGVPHIRAASQRDALIAQGYVTAQDRLWQMDSLRRLAGGNLAEIVGPRAVELDRESRELRLRRIAEQGYVRLLPEDRAALAAYTLGVNQFIATHRTELPVEFILLGYQPRPWSAIDSLLICLHMFRDLTNTWRNDLIKRSMLADADAQKVNFLFASRSGNEPLPGSNAWALAGSRTASGKPILSNDMHLEYSMPGIWYMTHLNAPGLDVSGVALPGVPGVVVGHNQRVAWGITNLQFDVQDLYLEKMDDNGHYLYKGQVEQAQQERELIPVKGQSPIEMPVWVTRHGPIILTDGAQRVALRWTAAEPGALQFPVLDINHAQNWEQFTTALKRWTGPGANFVYADVDGNIGYHAAGSLPKRHGFAGDVPVEGSSGDWRHPIRRIALGLQPARRHHCQRQSKSLSAGLSLSGEWQLRAARPGDPDPQADLRAHRLAPAGHAGGADGCLLRVQ